LAATEVPAAALAFDAIAEQFDARFTPWRSVAAQRRAVRSALAGAFPPGARLIEIGGGTGDDAIWLAERGRNVLMTDASPAMVRVAQAKFAGRGRLAAEVAAAESLEALAAFGPFEGAYSNFAGLNCVADLSSFARGLARLVASGNPVMLVLFGTCCPGETIVEGLRGRPRNMFRRFRRGEVPARLGGREFAVRYHRGSELSAALSPWFEPAGRRGIGVFVPPSAAEPWISRHPHLLGALEALDRALARPLAVLGDHILYRFVRTAAAAS
jgi:hypothetical protein